MPPKQPGSPGLAGAGPGSAEVVGVREVGSQHLTLDRLEEVAPTRSAAAAFGAALAVTHATGAPAFGHGPDGWQGDGFLGRQVLTLVPQSDWGMFFAEQRLLPYAVKARAGGNLTSAGLRTVERVCHRLAAGEFDDNRPPARIHGDLWTGNVMFTGSGVVLIDPAAHGGHGMTDLAMLALFGAPHLSTITASYAEAARLDPDWPELIALHQLHPLLVHAVSHSAAYGQQAVSLAQRYA